MKKSFFLRTVSLGIISSMMIASVANAAFSSNYINSRPIGVQTTYFREEGENSSGPQKANYIEYVPNPNVAPMIAYGNGLYGRSTITRIAKFLEDKGMNVLGGINADFFVLNTGIPIGLVINNGVLISSDASQYAVGFMADGTAIINKPSMNMKITGERGEVKVDYYNKSRSKHGIYLLDSNFSNETKINTPGSNILLERLDNAPVTVGGAIPMKVISTGKADYTSHIYSNQMVLTVSDDGPTSRFVNYQIGDTVTLTITPPEANAQWKDVLYAVGGKSLIENGAITASNIDAGTSKAPRSAVGIKADGTVVMYEIDGRQSSYSVGLTASELAQQMLSLGCVTALCLDGGGSSSMVVQYPGNSDSEVVSRASDGSLRACANYIMLVNKAPQTGVPTHLAIYPDRQYALPGASVELSVKATDDGFYPVVKPTDIVYTVANDMGIISGTTFIAGQTLGTATIEAASSTAYGKYNVLIQNKIDTIVLKKAGTVLSTLSASGGQSIDLDAYTSYKKLAVASNDRLLKWTVDGNIGTINENGVFTAYNSPANGKITVSYNGVSASIPVSVGLGAPQTTVSLGNFELTQPFTSSDENIKLSVTSDYDKVYRGYNALKVDYDFSENETISLLSSPVSVAGMSSYSMWIKGLDNEMQLDAIFTDINGNPLTAPLSYAVDTNFVNVTGAIPEGASEFVGVSIKKGALNKGTFYIDQLTASPTPISYSDYPKITINQSPESLLPNKSATVKAVITAASNSIHLESKNIAVYVDGVSTKFSYDTSTAALSVTTSNLASGVHRVTIEAVGSTGNRTRQSVDIKVSDPNTQDSSYFTDTIGNWADPYINFVAKKDVIKGEQKNGSNVFSPLRNLTRAEFAVIMARYLNLTPDPDASLSSYADKSKIPSWAQSAVKAVSEKGIMTGSVKNGKTYFNPSATITRGEVMTVISKSLVRGYAVNNVSFTDSNQIPTWAVPHVNTLVSMNLVSGFPDGSIKTSNKITRAEIAKILYGLY